MMCSGMRLWLCDNRDATVSKRCWQSDNRDVIIANAMMVPMQVG